MNMLKTLFNIVEAWFKKLLISLLYDDFQMEQ